MTLEEWTKTCHVGDTFVYDGKRIKCVRFCGCSKCVFNMADCYENKISCRPHERDDKQSVIYDEVVK